MKALILILLLLVAPAFGQTDVFSIQDSENKQLEDKAEFPHFEQTERWIVIEAKDAGRKGSWEFDRKQCPELIKKVKLFLKDSINNPAISKKEKKEIKYILSNWKQYSCQFVPYTQGGELFVHMNLFPFDSSSFNVEKNYCVISDGGADYWKITYKVKEDKFEDLRINGHA